MISEEALGIWLTTSIGSETKLQEQAQRNGDHIVAEYHEGVVEGYKRVENLIRRLKVQGAGAFRP